jgi:hypothetical protein
MFFLHFIVIFIGLCLQENFDKRDKKSKDNLPA